MPIAHGFTGKNLDELLSEIETGGQTTGLLIQESRLLPDLGELVDPQVALDEEWIPIVVDPADSPL